MPGPPPAEDVLRRNVGRFTDLPAEGRKGPIPKWPLAGRRRTGEAALWNELWRMPHAIVWEEQRLARVVARYCRLAIAAEASDAPSALSTEVRQLEDRLLLNPVQLRKAYYRIAPTVPEKGAEAKNRRRRALKA